MSTVSVVIPVYNAAGHVERTVTQVRSVLDECADAYEVVLVDDGSVDDTWKVLSALATDIDEVRAIRLERNFGEQNAVLCGIRAARLDVIVTIDDDLQQPPSEIPLLLDAMTPDVDLVYGIADRYGHSLFRRLMTALTKFVIEHVFRVPRARKVTSFRAFRTPLRQHFEASPGPRFSIDGLLGPATTRTATVTVRHVARGSGRSSYTIPKLAAHTVSLITTSSPAPLMFAWVLSAFCLVSAAVFAAVFVVWSLIDWSPTNLYWLAAGAMVGLFGALFLSVGILGQYAARVLMRLGGLPPYVVAEELDHGV